jgi:propanol-preferring alcohol dehydrogenase
MKALQYRTIGSAPEVVTVADPEPEPGEVLLKVTAAGVCHSDIAVMEWPAEGFPYRLPMTLGHEGVGTVAALGRASPVSSRATRSPSTARGAAACAPSARRARRTTAWSPGSAGSTRPDWARPARWPST